MDLRLNSAAALEPQMTSGGMPPENPVYMPPQDLGYRPPRRPRHWSGAAVLYARFILATITCGVTTYGVYQMLQVVRFASMTLLQGLMIFFFAVSLGWIAFAAGSVLAGASKRRDPNPPSAPGSAPGPEPCHSLTALVMPIYNEDPLRTTTALQAMAEALAHIDAHRDFEIVILSDSTNADAWIRETLSVDRLRKALLSIMPVWYRRRWQNIARKSGNLEDFVTRWGGRYDHMIVLDADSLIDAAHAAAAGAGHAERSGLGDSANRSAADRRDDPLRPAAAIRRLRLRARHHARLERLVRRQRQLLGAQRHHPRRRVRAELRPAARSRAASPSAASCCRTTSSRRR